MMLAFKTKAIISKDGLYHFFNQLKISLAIYMARFDINDVNRARTSDEVIVKRRKARSSLFFGLPLLFFGLILLPEGGGILIIIGIFFIIRYFYFSFVYRD